ncbi:MAG: aminoglycoside phosphotransferase [Deltaproteobacteria bacterium]|nr:aminoglycoside phosphotransferase [Deltaproteobacteria bacterium]
MADLPAGPRLRAAAAHFGADLNRVRPLAGDGSERRFYRLEGAPSLVLLWHPHPPGGAVNENDSYVLIGRHLRRRGLPAPEIYEYSREEGWALLEDLGNLSLEEALAGRPAGQRRGWHRRALDLLIDLQFEGITGFDPAWCFDTPAVTPEFLLERECGYFLREFVQGCLGMKIPATELAPDFARLVARALPGGPAWLMHRDFQSRNLMVQGERLRLIDFQGCRLGPLGYDVAALLIDPYVDPAPDEQEELLDYYLGRLGERLPGGTDAFRDAYEHLALSRNLQILGAFGFLTRSRGKPQFARSIPPALASLKRRLAALAGDYPRLARLAAGLELG